MHYTPTEQRMIELLSDGLPHDRQELLEVSQLTDLHCMAVSIMRLRPKLRALGQEIDTVLWRGSIAYRHIVLLSGTNLSNDPT